MKALGTLVAIAFAVAVPITPAQNLILVNPLAVDRTQEVVEIPLSQVLSHLHLAPGQAPSIVAQDAATGQRVPSQLYTDTPDAAPDGLLLLVQLPAHSRQRIAFRLDADAN